MTSQRKTLIVIIFSLLLLLCCIVVGFVAAYKADWIDQIKDKFSEYDIVKVDEDDVIDDNDDNNDSSDDADDDVEATPFPTATPHPESTIIKVDGEYNNFSVDLFEYADDITVKIELPEWAISVYVFCHDVSNPSFKTMSCDAGTAEIFRITLYDVEDAYTLQTDPMFKNNVMLVYEFADTSAYLLEMPNEDYPEEITGLGLDYYQKVANSFELDLIY